MSRFPSFSSASAIFEYCGGHSLRSTVASAVALTAAVASVLAGATAARAGSNDLDTAAGATGTFRYQGPISALSVGEVLMSPSSGDHFLTTFTFYMSNTTSTFKDVAQVYAWNGTQAIGSALFTSSPFTISLSSTYTPYTIDTSVGGGLNLTPGSQYIVLFTYLGAGNPSGTTGGASVLLNTNNPDSHGYYSFNSTASTQIGWTSPNSGFDLAVKATFGDGTLTSPPAAVPEPGVIVSALSMAGMTGLALLRGRRTMRQNMTGA